MYYQVVYLFEKLVTVQTFYWPSQSFPLRNIGSFQNANNFPIQQCKLEVDLI